MQWDITDTVISIHALLAESDWQAAKALDRLRISIHALLAESDLDHGIALVPHQHFYPRSPCGERLSSPNTDIIILDISIHALLAESDNLSYYFRKYLFLISIHALLAESDSLVLFERLLIW